MISDVKNALYADLLSITEGNGYNTNTKKVYKVPKMLNEIHATDMPCWSVFLINAPSGFDQEMNYYYNLNYGIICFHETKDDVDENGDLENKLTLMYEDFVSKMKTGSTLQVDGVEEIEIKDFLPILDKKKGQGYIPITIKYNGG